MWETSQAPSVFTFKSPALGRFVEADYLLLVSSQSLKRWRAKGKGQQRGHRPEEDPEAIDQRKTLPVYSDGVKILAAQLT